MKRLLCTALGIAAASLSCVDIEPDEPVDENGEPVEVPDPHDSWLQVEGIAPAPGNLAPSSPIVVAFSDYLDDDSFRSYDFAALVSGGVQSSGEANYRMTDKAVVWRPSGELEEGFEYTFLLNTDVNSATGAPLASASSWPSYTIHGEAESPDLAALPEARWDDVEPIFSAECARCHADESWGLNSLEYDALVGRRSEQTELPLVRPGDPADSYLMRKLLSDYPDIEFTHQPPAWDEESEPLSVDELRLIEGWIKHGARR